MNKNFWKKLDKPFSVLAPMENVTDFVFREIVSTILPKPDVLFTEFTNTDALNSIGFEKTIHRFKKSKFQKPIVAQIWGTKPENFLKSAKIANDLGFDGIDINMGCPVKDVVKIGACSALIDNPNLAKEIIEATKEGAKNIPTSVKTRIGTKSINTQSWITFLLEQNIDALTIHGRTAKEMSDVPAHWDEIKKSVDIKNSLGKQTIMIGNGDVCLNSEILEKHKEYGVDGVMIGRGIFKNPWIFEKESINHTFAEVIKIAKAHVVLFQKTYKDKDFNILKKFFKMYIKDFDGASKLRSEIMDTKSIEDILYILTREEVKNL